ncbi:hypothetical protein NLU13_2076 [Sarocladium strictum]|uniref:Uncharacterized protein n=1 Tax=Sarocladium strictum TaxID=5046 RepID=A0AA39LCC7_SARSR|nr:hypothetical protein NLU13_2076 [Sarocladium strictum]
MSAVWGRLRAVSSTEVLQLPLNKKQRREDASRIAQEGASDKAFWQYNFDSRLNALGITTTTGTDPYPYRYEIQKGKTVPRNGDAKEAMQLDRSSPVSYIEDDVHDSPVFTPPPPRNPLRKLQRDPNWRPTSSIYDIDVTVASPSAVPSPLQVNAAKMDTRVAATQISPPSSPDIDSPVRKLSPEDVSPIDDEFDMSQQDMIRGAHPISQAQLEAGPKVHASPPHSSIPTMRRDRRKQQEAALATRRETRNRDSNTPPPVKATQHSHSGTGGIPRSDGMRWDRGGSPSFGQSSLNPSPPEELPMGCTTTISGPVRSPRDQHSPSFGERVRQLGIGRSKPEPVESRPAWNGASGRSVLVQPVRDNIRAAPLQAPPKTSRRAGRGRGVPTNEPSTPGPSETRSGPADSAHQTLPSQVAQRHQQPLRMPLGKDGIDQRGVSPQDDGAQSYPSPPYSGSPMRMSPETARLSRPPTNTSEASSAQLPMPPIVIPNAGKAIKRKPPPAHSNHKHPAQGSLSANTLQSARNETAAAEDHDDGWVQPPSRFSISTRATSHTGSPRPSGDDDRPPVPDAAAATPSVMDRSRPRYADEVSDAPSAQPIVISVKPFSTFARKDKTAHEEPAMPAPQRRETSSADVNKGRPLSVMSTSKALPPAPPELLSAHDRVGNLKARLDNLAHRRNNINRSIKQMTELMPNDNLMASAEVLRKREIERLKVERLREELADVQQEEYELGLKLHRAYKRLDREAEFEPTGLWVRRVTG